MYNFGPFDYDGRMTVNATDFEKGDVARFRGVGDFMGIFEEYVEIAFFFCMAVPIAREMSEFINVWNWNIL